MKSVTLKAASLLAGYDVTQLAQGLIDKTLPEEDAVQVLTAVDVEPDTSALLTLSQLLADVLEPLAQMGVSCNEQDIRLVRRFFLGVMGWTPDVVMQQATLEDLADAFTGYCAVRGLTGGQAPSQAFLISMMEQFPDQEEQHDT